MRGGIGLALHEAAPLPPQTVGIPHCPKLDLGEIAPGRESLARSGPLLEETVALGPEETVALGLEETVALGLEETTPQILDRLNLACSFSSFSFLGSPIWSGDC